MNLGPMNAEFVSFTVSPPNFLEFRVTFLPFIETYIVREIYRSGRMRTEDGCIIQECLNGKPEAFGMLVDKYKAGIYAFVYGRLRNFQDAQDVTQEVFEQAYRSLRNLRRWESFVFWLYRIARNLCANWFQDQSRRPDREFIADQDPSALEVPSLDSYRESRLDESLREALDLLPEAYREVLMLHYFAGMTSRDIATAVGASPNAIRMRLSRARSQLREEMVPMMDTAIEGQKLTATFTFRIVEAVKRIKIHTMPRTAGLPWGLSLAVGVIIAILSINPQMSIPTDIAIPTGSPLPAELKVLKTGEIPVEILRTFEISIIGGKQGDGGAEIPRVPEMYQAAPMISQGRGDIWIKRADMPTARFYLATTAADGKIYAIGGYSTNGFVPTVEEYDPVKDEWKEKADMPTTREGLSACAVDGSIYAMGGYGEGQPIEFPLLEKYDPQTDKWTRKASMLTGRQFFSASVVNGKIYAIGGWRGAQAISAVEEYDPVADKWAKKTDMPTARYGASAVAVNGKIYVIGGCPIGELPTFKDNVTSIVEEYDPATDKWTEKTGMPTSRMFLSASVVNGRIYAIGGYNNDAGGILSVVEEYDPLTGKWAEKADMPTARVCFSASAVNGRIYAIGGNNLVSQIAFSPIIRGALSAVEEYDTEANDKDIEPIGKLPTSWGGVKSE